MIYYTPTNDDFFFFWGGGCILESPCPSVRPSVRPFVRQYVRLTVRPSVRPPVEATCLSGLFSPLTSAKACGKSSRWLWKEKLCQYWCEKARKHICVTDHHDMTLAVKVALNLNTTNQTVRPCVTKSCLGHNFKSITASNFKLHTQIDHIVEKCSVQES